MVRALIRLALVVAPCIAIALTVAASAPAAIANVRIGSVATSSSSSLAVTMSAGSTAGDLLVATISSNSASAFSGPSGWVQGPTVSATGTNPGRAAVWYYPNNPGGISSATFTTTSATVMAGQLSEWSGVATSSPLDASGTATNTSATSITVSTTGAPTTTGGVGIAAFDLAMNKSQSITFTPGTGWTTLGSNGTTVTNAYSANYKLNNGTSVVSEAEGSNKSGDFSATMAVFKPAPTCSGGSLGLTVPGTASFTAVTLNGTNQSQSTNLVLTPDDETGSGAGWNVTGTSSLFNNGSGHNLSATATAVTAASVAAGSPNCNLPTNSIGYPVTLPAGAGPPTAVKLYNAGAGTGKGQQSLTLTFLLALPANTYRGTYTSTWTFAIVSGP